MLGTKQYDAGKSFLHCMSNLPAGAPGCCDSCPNGSWVTKDSTRAASSASCSPGSQPFKFPMAASRSTLCIMRLCRATKSTAWLLVSERFCCHASSLLTTCKTSKSTRVMRFRLLDWCCLSTRCTGSSGSKSITCNKISSRHQFVYKLLPADTTSSHRTTTSASNATGVQLWKWT